MQEDHFDDIKESVLAHIQQLFEQMEEDMVMSHQEKYAMLEDAFGQATDEDELRVAFEQWYSDHSEDLQLDADADELWEHAIAGSDAGADEDEEKY